MTELRWPTWIGVIVKDLEAQRLFHRETLGFREIESGDGWVQFDIDGKLFELLQRSDRPQYQIPRYQVGFTVDDIHAAREELIAKGVEPISEIEGEETGSTNAWCYLGDPGGNVFEITQWLDSRT